MSSNVMSACHQCKAEGVKLFLKGDKCLGAKCPIVKKSSQQSKPGKKSYYGLQLREKQKMKRFYGVSESQFFKYFGMASLSGGNTGSLFIETLERRLDNVVHRMGLAVSRRQARQMVSHCLFRYNGIRVSIPSILVKPGDVIELVNSKREFALIQENIKRNFVVPSWLNKKDDFSAEVVYYPNREEMNDILIKEQMIIELYSR